MSLIGVIPTFDLGQDWITFKERLTHWLTANLLDSKEVKKPQEDVRRRAVLMSALSEPAFKLVRELIAPKTVDDFTYGELILEIEKHVMPKKSLLAERHRFHAATQEPGEDFTQWAARVRQLSTDCQFGSALEEMLRDRFVLGLIPGTERNKLFLENASDLSLNRAVEIAVTLHSAKQAAQQSARPGELAPTASATGEVHKVAQSATAADRERCDVCGYYNHKTVQCRFKAYKCRKCGEKGHLARRCRNGNAQKKVLHVSDDGSNEDDGRDSAVDLSKSKTVLQTLRLRITNFSCTGRALRYLSLARNNMRSVPMIFTMNDNSDCTLSETIEYLSLFGNQFGNVSVARYSVILNATNAQESSANLRSNTKQERNWFRGFENRSFPRLRELDLRSCSIKTLNKAVFRSMPALEALYLGENQITQVKSNAFAGLTNLVHLDLSRNIEHDAHGNPLPMTFEVMNIFEDLVNLTSLDLSMTLLSPRHTRALKSLSKKLQRLSLCSSGVSRLDANFFEHTSIIYLDVSDNFGLLKFHKVLTGLEDTLKVLYADLVELKSFEHFKGFGELEILKISSNEISQIPIDVASTLTKLQILEMDMNRMTAWREPVFSLMPKLKFLSLNENNINIITDEMMQDFKSVSFLSLTENFVICNCQVMELYDMAVNRQSERPTGFKSISAGECQTVCFHTGFEDFNRIIEQNDVFDTERSKNILRQTRNFNLKNKSGDSIKNKKCNGPCNITASEKNMNGSIVLLGSDVNNYQCLHVEQGKQILFSELKSCQPNGVYMEEHLQHGNMLLSLLVIPVIALIILALVFIFRRNIRYFCITMRNTATLSIINEPLDDIVYNYDVFVSYCHEDRNWVLDEFLPHVEKDCNINVCLHERDFQVGLSILENIVSCMDRSRLIMLVLSKQFLKSQWCKFEMHLAQHRLLETRREDLILILLEDIPRHLRPNTLHYLMLTKTYVVWPNKPDEEILFWRRLKKSLLLNNSTEQDVSNKQT